MGDVYEDFTGKLSTRKLFDQVVLNAEEGITVLYAASANQSALDGAYIYSVLKVCKMWEDCNKTNMVLTIKDAHTFGIKYIKENFITRQIPEMNVEKRLRYYPLAVKFVPLHG